MDEPAGATPSSSPEDLAAVDQRHLREARLLQAKALEALRRMQLRTAAQAVAALDRGIRLERLILEIGGSRSHWKLSKTRQTLLW